MHVASRDRAHAERDASNLSRAVWYSVKQQVDWISRGSFGPTD